MSAFSSLISVLARGPWQLGGEAPLLVRLDPVRDALVFMLVPGVHLTVHRSAWDGQVTIVGPEGELCVIGPLALFVTAGERRWFLQRERGAWRWVSGYGAPGERIAGTIDAMVRTFEPLVEITERRRR